jgi:hypothetical protein
MYTRRSIALASRRRHMLEDNNTADWVLGWEFDDVGGAASENTGTDDADLPATLSGDAAMVSGGYMTATNGTSSGASIPDNALLKHAIDEPFSFAVRFRLSENTNTFRRIVEKEINNGWAVYTNGTPQAVVTIAAETRNVTSEALPTGEWIVVAATYDPDHPTAKQRYYYKGEEFATANDASAVTTTQAVGVGYRASTGSNSFDGDIDWLRVWNKVLTAEEVAALG